MKDFKKIEPGMVITVGAEYAAQMDYEAASGHDAVILNMEEAVSQIALLTSDTEEIGASYEIHNEDLLYTHHSPEHNYYAFLDMSTGHIYYTEDKGLYDFAPRFMSIRSAKFFKNFDYMHRILDQCNGTDAVNTVPFSREKEILSCIVFCLDDENSKTTALVKNAYERHKSQSTGS